MYKTIEFLTSNQTWSVVISNFIGIWQLRYLQIASYIVMIKRNYINNFQELHRYLIFPILSFKLHNFTLNEIFLGRLVKTEVYLSFLHLNISIQRYDWRLEFPTEPNLEAQYICIRTVSSLRLSCLLCCTS